MPLPPVTGVEMLIINEPEVIVSTSPLVITGGLTDQSRRLHFGDAPGGLGGSERTTITSMLRQRGTATIALKVWGDDDYNPTVGCQVFLYDVTETSQSIIFVGTIDKVDWSWWNKLGTRLASLSCVSLEQTFDVIRVPGHLYEHETAGAIFANLLLLATGWPGTVGRIDPGPVIDTFLIENFPTISELFTKLAGEAGFVWSVDITTLTINFTVPAITPAPFVLLQDDVLWQGLDLNGDRHDYRNRQAIAIAYDSIGRSAELFIGAGQTSFALRNPVHQVMNAWITKNLQNTATGTFTGQPNDGDYVTISYPKSGSSYNWAPNAPYTSGQIIVDPLSHIQQCTVSGTSGASEPIWNDVGGATSDNTVRWTDKGNTGFGPYQVATYTFVTEIDNTIFGLVLIGATAAETTLNLIDAINSATLTRGIKYSLPTWENPLINADAPDITGLTFTIRDKGATAGSIAALNYNSTAFSWSGVATSGGLTTFGTYAISVGIAAANTQGLSYTPGSNIVTLPSPLNAGTNLQVEYQRIDGQLIQVEDTPLVTARAALEHSTGKYQALMSDNTGASPVQGLNEALASLKAFRVIPEFLNFQTLRTGLMINQALSVDFSFPGGPDLLIGSDKGAYQFRRLVTLIPPSPPEVNVANNFTVLIKGVYPYLATVPNGGDTFNPHGFDIIFTADADGRELMNWEIQSYDETTGEIMFWVLWPLPLDRTFPTTFYMFYANPGIKSFQSPGGAFTLDYYGVYHLRETASPYRDSSEVRNDATGDSDPIEVAGLFGPAQRFRISGPNTLKMPTIPVSGDFGGIGLTVEFWIKANDTTNIQMIVDTGYGQLQGTQVYIENGGTLRVFDVHTTSSAATPNPVADGTWHFVVAVNDSLGFINIWVDAVHVVNYTSVGVPAAENGTTAIGIGKGDLHPFDGILEEFRFGTHSVLQPKVNALYTNQNPGTINTFYSIGPPVTWGLAPWIIQEVDAELIPTQEAETLGGNDNGEYGRWRYTIRCVNSAQIGSYIDFWLGLGGGGGGLADSSSGVNGSPLPSTATTGNSVSVAQGGIVIGAEPILNFIEGSGVAFLIGNDPGNNRVNITITADSSVFITYGRYADLPPVLTVAPGTLYFFKDSLYLYAYSDGTQWIIFADGRQMFLPSLKPWIGGAAVVDIDNGFSTMLILPTFSPPQTWQFQWGSIGYPTGVTYSFTAGFRLTPPLVSTETGLACLFFSDGNNTILYGVFATAGAFNLTIQTATSFDGVTGNSVIIQETIPISSPIVWLRVSDDTAHQKFEWSTDKVRWQQFYKEVSGWFLSATHLVGWGGKQGLQNVSLPKKLGTATFIDMVSFEGEVSASYAFTTTTTKIGAGTPSRELTITTTEALTGTATFTPDDMGAGGVFYPTSVTLPAGAAGQHVGFVYIADIARTDDVSIVVAATGGGAWGVGGMILPIGSDTQYARDTFVGTAAAAVLGRTPDAGAAWTRPYNGGTIDLLLDGSGGCYATGAPNPSVRGTAIVASTSNPVFIAWPTGTITGDIAFVLAANENNIFNISGWINAADNGSQVSGFWAYKTLTSGDITAGGVSVTPNGTFPGNYSLTIIIGGTASVREIVHTRNSSGATSRTVTTSSAVAAGDLAILFGSTRVSTTPSISPGTQQGSPVNNGMSGVLNTYAVTAGGALTGTFTYPSAGAGDFQIIVIVQGGSVGSTEYQIPTAAPTLINDVACTYTNINTATLEATVAMFGDAGAHVSGYVLYTDPTGTGASAWVAGVQTQFTAPTGSTLSGDHVLRIAVRLINNHQFVFFLIDGLMLTGAPWQDNSITTGYASLVPTLSTAPSSSDSVCTEIRGSNADWS